ncbi:MAG: hypothetical protein J6Y54_04485 [Lentisphaeria bacterium]|jgi:hypothetical protein|nr:hypothetical protein [Lentisphaeria bacterium]
MKEVSDISLPGKALPAAEQPMMSVPAPRADTTVVSVAASSECAYRICGHFGDFFCTVKSELLRAVRAAWSIFRPRRRTLATVAPAVCCGYSRTILGWRL